MRGMTKTHTLLIASAAAAAMVVVGVVAASAAGSKGSGGGALFLAAASPTPGFKSNETSAHEAAEPQETAENNGTFRPAGHSGGAPNETSAHETGETAAQEAAENTRASSTATPSATH